MLNKLYVVRKNDGYYDTIVHATHDKKIANAISGNSFDDVIENYIMIENDSDTELSIVERLDKEVSKLRKEVLNLEAEILCKEKQLCRQQINMRELQDEINKLNIIIDYKV